MKQISEYIKMCMKGDVTLTERLTTFEAHKQAVLNQIDELNKYLRKIDFKIDYYKTAIEAGTEAIHAQTECTWLDIE
ncbi:hypothetical protein [Paenibacillus gorillae]|uniref:hypothetical protein n=1 Tax=Paenibacillus gorillae TaxID=1243662 RepID=UPI00307BA4AE